MTAPLDRAGHRNGTSDPFRALVRDLVLELAPEIGELARQAVHAELARGAGQPEWLSPKAACALAGWRSTSTLREHVAAGHLTRGRRGRVRADELRAFLASRDPAPTTSPAPTPLDLNRERARRAAAEIRAGLSHKELTR